MSRSTLNYYVMPLFIFLIVSIWRNPGPFIEPRFWAEEASMYFKDVQVIGWINAVTLIENSNLQLLTNFFVKVADYASLNYAPFITTYLSATYSLILPFVVGVYAKEYKIPLPALFLGVTYLSLAHMTYEIFASSTNIQWYCGAIMFVCLFLKTDSKGITIFLLIVAVLCGLTGIPSVILTPAFFAVWAVRRSNFHLIIGFALLICTAIQAMIVFNLDNPSRHFTTSPRLLMLPSMLHSIYGFWLAPDSVRALGSTAVAVTNFVPIALVSGIVVFLLLSLNEKSMRILAAFIIIVGFGAAVVQTFGALGSPVDLLGGPANGGRYYFVSTVAMTLTIMLAATSHKYTTLALLSCAVLAQGVAAYSPSWNVFSSGPSWIHSIEQCQNSPCSVDIWPAGLKADIRVH